MSIYIAYQFEPRQLSKKRLEILVKQFVDLELLCNNQYSNPTEVLQMIEETHAKFSERGIQRPNNLLSKAGTALTEFSVLDYPLLLMQFWYQRDNLSSKYVPKNFNGINIHASHSGTEGIVDLIEFKPKADVFLYNTGIDYIDRSNLEL